MMKAALEQIKYDLKEHADFGKVSIIDALSAIDAAAQHYYRQGGLDAAKIGNRETQYERMKTINLGEHDASLSAVVYGMDMAISAQNQAILTHFNNPNLEIPK